MALRPSITLLAGIFLAGLAVALPLPARGQTDNDYPYVGVSYSGTVTVANVDVDHDRLAVLTSGGKRLAVDASSADITLRNTTRAGEVGDLVPQMRLHVTGLLLARNIIMASAITVLPLRPPAAVAASPKRVQTVAAAVPQVRLRGTVLLVETDSQQFIVRVNDHTRTIHVDAQTQRPDLPASANGMPLMEPGDRVSVVGVMLPDGTIKASLVTARMLPPNLASPPQPGAGSPVPLAAQPVARTPAPPAAPATGDSRLTGILVSVANKYSSRDLTVETGDGRDIQVSVEHGAVVRRDGLAVSMHDLKAGETVSVEGRLDGATLDADRVDAGTHEPSDFHGAVVASSPGE